MTSQTFDSQGPASDMVTWRELITQEMSEHGDSLDDIDGAAPPVEDWLDVEFDDDLGCFEGHPFAVWTAQRVYFPVGYDGVEWCQSVPRHPCDEPIPHIGRSS